MAADPCLGMQGSLTAGSRVQDVGAVDAASGRWGRQPPEAHRRKTQQARSFAAVAASRMAWVRPLQRDPGPGRQGRDSL